ncbi:protein tyrosine phosphatase family protein [uncultured Tateyamaria sp.]|uniref:protein tyrosine phosphatase family protein n=1 Tax=uncultured Tateyamaria sp. TaxID=455651 RepID=UPI00262E36DB|nr:protein tyrosine phosphatase family protein [uncultured Tateyamaria sp.]
MRFIALSLIGFFLAVTAAVAELSQARNFYQYSESVLTAGQPTEEQLKSAGAAGVEVVISVVPPSERVYNAKQGDILAKQGIEYIHVPVNWRAPDDASFDAFMAAMDKVGDRKVLVHCWANARASALVYAHRVLSAPDTQPQEFETLRSVWSDVAGYNLDADTTWQNYLADNIARVQ